MKMKKVLSLFLTGLICLTSIPFTAVSAEEAEEIVVWDGSADSFWYNDIDTEFHISTAEEFAGLAKLVNSGNNMDGKTIYLEDDIYLNDISDYDTWNETAPDNMWTSIGIDNYNRFKGNFSGENHTVYGLYNQAVFGYADSNATIQNLHLIDSFITTSISYDSCYGYSSGKLYAGSICGYSSNDAIIKNCTNIGKIDVEHEITYLYVGGVCGYSNGTISNCRNSGEISAISTDVSVGKNVSIYVGGICGFNYSYGLIDCCSNYSNDSAIYQKTQDDFYPDSIASGGISGKSFGLITNCYNCGVIKATNESGGIAGNCGDNEDEIINCYNSGVVESDGLYGGIVGESYGYYECFKNCYYLNTSSSRGIGDIENDTIVNPNESTMKKESFAQTLGDAFVYVEDDFPKLAWEIYGIVIEGDINNDGTLNVTDLVILQKYLLNAYSMSLDEWNRSDLCVDGSVDVFDMCILRRLLLSQ